MGFSDDNPATAYTPPGRELVSVVMPAYREAAGIARAVGAVHEALHALGMPHELIVIDDGSDDQTFGVLKQLLRDFPMLRAIRLSRRFGKEGALLAGLRLARGRAIITMDSDLQHPPELIPRMIECWREGYSVVNGVKRHRGDEGAIRRLRARAFNAVISRLGGIELQNATDFKLLDRLALDTILTSFPEKIRFYRGLTRWIGFEQIDVPFDVTPRIAGQSAWTGSSLAALAVNSIVAHSSAPLRVITYIGTLTMLIGAWIGADAAWSWFTGHTVAGFPTQIITTLMVNAAIMISVGILGEYIAKIYDEIKARPNYIVAQSLGGERSSDAWPARNVAAQGDAGPADAAVATSAVSGSERAERQS
jgi:glycosyltransferase involved in cell wall biosynthesis